MDVFCGLLKEKGKKQQEEKVRKCEYSNKEHFGFSHHLSPIDPFLASAAPYLVDQVLYLRAIANTPLLLQTSRKVPFVVHVVSKAPSNANAEHDAPHDRATGLPGFSSLETVDSLIDRFDDLGALRVIARDHGVQVHVCRRAKDLRSEHSLMAALVVSGGIHAGVVRRHRNRARLFEDLFDALTTLDEFRNAEPVLAPIALLPRCQLRDLRESIDDVVLATHDREHRVLFAWRERMPVNCGSIVWGEEFGHDIPHDRSTDKRRGCKHVKPDGGFDDEP